LARMSGEEARVRRELEILREIAANQSTIPFVPTLLRAFQEPQSMCLLFKQRAVCELSSLAAQYPGGVLDDGGLNFIGACLSRALDVLHSEYSVIYRNLAPERIHVLDDGYMCLMDLRFAKRDDGSCLTLCGSPSYFAPEMVRGDIQGFQVDWWGLGVLLFELATGDSPWGATDDDDMVLLKRISSHVSGALAIPAHVNPQLSALLNDLLEPDVDARRGDSSVVMDPWFDDVNWSRLLDGELPSPLQRVAKKTADEALQAAATDENEIESPDWALLARSQQRIAQMEAEAAGKALPSQVKEEEEGEDDWLDVSFGGPTSIVNGQPSTGSVLSRVHK
jgi:protein kinase A